MKKIAIVLLLAVSFAACNKMGDSDNTMEPVAQLEGFYSNEITSNTCDEYVQVLSFGDNRIYDIDLFSADIEDAFVNSVPFTIRYSTNGEEGVIVPAGHDYIDSIYFFKEDSNDELVALLFCNGIDYPNDSLQYFVKNDWFEKYVIEQVAFEGEFKTEPYCIGPANESELDTTDDMELDADFYLPDEKGTKFSPAAAAGGSAAAAAKWLGNTFLSTTFSYGLTSLYSCIFNNDDATVQNEKKLNDILRQTKEINSKLEDINKRVKELDRKLDRKAVTDKIEKRNAMYTAIHDVNYRYYNQLKDLRKNSDLVSDTAKLKEAIIPIIKEWGNTVVDGSPAYTSLKRVINMITENVSGMTFFSVYDIFVFNTHNWENEGYVDREAFRTSDLGIVAECCFLVKLFYSVNNEKTMIEENDRYLQKFIEFYKANQVVRNNNVCVCQIQGAHLYLQPKARRITYENPTWLGPINQREIVVGNREDRMKISESLLLFAGQPHLFIQPHEAKAIIKAYGNKENLDKILTKYGCCVSINAGRVFIPLASGHSYAFPKPKSYYYSQTDMPEWMDVSLCTINSNNPNCYAQKLGRIKFYGEKGWTKERFLFIKKTVFDTWHLKFSGWVSQETTQDWWNYDVIKRYN